MIHFYKYKISNKTFRTKEAMILQTMIEKHFHYESPSNVKHLLVNKKIMFTNRYTIVTVDDQNI